ISRDTLCFSMYSLISMLIISFSSSKRNSASARASSVFPTPVGPRKMNEPIGRLVSESPARLRRTAFDTRSSASSCPTTRCRSRQFLLDLLAPLLRVRIGFLQQRLALNFQLHDAPLDLVNLHGQGIDLHAQARRRLVDQVDGLVRQEAV